MTPLQREKACLVISDLRSGVDTLIDPKLLPPETVENSTLSQDAGAHIADTLATWVKKGFGAAHSVSRQSKASAPTDYLSWNGRESSDRS